MIKIECTVCNKVYVEGEMLLTPRFEYTPSAGTWCIDLKKIRALCPECVATYVAKIKELDEEYYRELASVRATYFGVDKEE